MQLKNKSIDLTADTQTFRTSSLIERLKLVSSETTAVMNRGGIVPNRGGCLHGLFEASADQAPASVAIECGDRAWSYGQLEAEANRMARHLRAMGIGRGSFVGLSLDRSEWPVIAILAVLKAGAAYVPIEPGLPDDRLQYIAEASG
ncbi:MAG: AMP-binding protein, partial [Hyphomicrobiaceae bacterium]